MIVSFLFVGIIAKADFYPPNECTDKAKGCIGNLCKLEDVTQASAGECLDIRAALILPCPDGKEFISIQGNCKFSYEIESSYCSPIKGEPNCIDLTITDFLPCEAGKTMISVKGKCLKDNEVEHIYCATR